MGRHSGLWPLHGAGRAAFKAVSRLSAARAQADGAHHSGGHQQLRAHEAPAGAAQKALLPHPYRVSHHDLYAQAEPTAVDAADAPAGRSCGGGRQKGLRRVCPAPPAVREIFHRAGPSDGRRHVRPRGHDGAERPRHAGDDRLRRDLKRLHEPVCGKLMLLEGKTLADGGSIEVQK